MKEAANSLLKILEEPPDFATIFLLTDNPSALLPTIRSRCMHLRLSPLTFEAVENTWRRSGRNSSRRNARWLPVSAAADWAAHAASIWRSTSQPGRTRWRCSAPRWERRTTAICFV